MKGRPTAARIPMGFGAVFFAAGALAAFMLLPLVHASDARRNGASEAVGAREAHPPAAADPAATAPRKIERPFLLRPVVPACPSTDPAAERSYRVQQSRELVALLRTKLAGYERRPLPGGPEALVNQLMPFVEGWAESTLRIGPDLVEEIADEIDAALCEPNASSTQLMLMSRVLRRLPEFANARGFDCVFAREQEDIVLWDALDAWRMTSLPRTPALERIAAQATDERTRWRLVKWSDEMAETDRAPSGIELEEPGTPSPSGDTPEAALKAAFESGQIGLREYETAIEEMRACPRGDCNGTAASRSP